MRGDELFCVVEQTQWCAPRRRPAPPRWVNWERINCTQNMWVRNKNIVYNFKAINLFKIIFCKNILFTLLPSYLLTLLLPWTIKRLKSYNVRTWHARNVTHTHSHTLRNYKVFKCFVQFPNETHIYIKTMCLFLRLILVTLMCAFNGPSSHLCICTKIHKIILIAL